MKKDNQIDASQFTSHLGCGNQCLRLLWTVIWTVFARPLPRSVFSGWKRFLLRFFGAEIASTAVVHSSARIYMPWNLKMDEYACMAGEVDCYNVAPVSIGAHATVSQKTYLCTASHDITRADMALLIEPITIGNQAWVAADCFIGKGVNIGEGAVVGARSSVFKDVAPWTVVGGNPARFIKDRIVK